MHFEISFQWENGPNSRKKEFRPDLETFIEAWQKASSVMGLHNTLTSELQKQQDNDERRVTRDNQ